jgi:hypothetical protein
VATGNVVVFLNPWLVYNSTSSTGKISYQSCHNGAEEDPLEKLPKRDGNVNKVFSWRFHCSYMFLISVKPTQFVSTKIMEFESPPVFRFSSLENEILFLNRRVVLSMSTKGFDVQLTLLLNKSM